MLFIPSNNITQIIQANLNHRAFNIKKCYDWLDINENTPIKIKLQVLDTCMFAAYLYETETWWKINDIADMILIKERKILKRVLGVKQGTPNDLIYSELERPDIISRIKDSQYKFNKKINTLQHEDAIVTKALEICKQLDIYNYYNVLKSDNQKSNKESRTSEVMNSVSTMNSRFSDLCSYKKNEITYESYINEDIRLVLTRWRLSNFELRIKLVDMLIRQRNYKSAIYVIKEILKTKIMLFFYVNFTMI